MNLVKWSVRDLVIPMVRHGEELYCTDTALCSALGISLERLHRHRHEHSELMPLPRADPNAGVIFAFLASLGMPDANDTHLWPLDEALMVTFRVKPKDMVAIVLEAKRAQS